MAEANEISTVQILKTDKEEIESLYGKPMYMAIHKALFVRQGGCVHPEAQREYTTATINAEKLGAVINADEKVTTKRAGFFCSACSSFVFPDPRAA